MTNPDEPVFGTIIVPSIMEIGDGMRVFGLTKRELFAAMAMQGQLASMSNAEVVKFLHQPNVDPYQFCAESACRYADALLAALSEDKK